MSFAVHARALIDFLRNHDNTIIRASDFIAQRPAPGLGKITGLMQLLTRQVLHLGMLRVRTHEGKFTTDDATPVYEWIEQEMAAFFGDLPKHYCDLWNEAKAGSPVKSIPRRTGVPSATNAPTSTSSVSGMTIIVPDGFEGTLPAESAPSAGTVPSWTGPESPFAKDR